MWIESSPPVVLRMPAPTFAERLHEVVGARLGFCDNHSAPRSVRPLHHAHGQGFFQLSLAGLIAMRKRPRHALR